MADFTLDEDQQQIQDMMRKFAQNELRAVARDCDEESKLPEEILNKVWELGFCPNVIPEQYGGYEMGRSLVTAAIMLEELAYGDVSLSLGALSPALMMVPILEFGTEEQKEEWLPQFCGEKFFPATAALMEPRITFDPFNLHTTVEMSGDVMLLNGKKCLVPLAESAKHILVYATTAKGSGTGSVEAIIVDKDSPGVEIGEKEKNMGLNPLPLYPVTFTDCEVPRAGRVGGDRGIDYKIVRHKFGLPMEFSPEALREADGIPDHVLREEHEKREDFRHEIAITIDSETARDYDDAVTLKKLTSGNYLLGVHIADVSYYIREGTALDAEAYARGTAVYFPECAIPMLPRKISSGICSLKPQEDRLVLSALMEVNRQGRIVRKCFTEGLLRSREKMSYSSVAKILVNRNPEEMQRYAHLVPLFKHMQELCLILSKKRYRRGAVDFDLPEADIQFDQNGKIINVVPAERNIAHRIIEEFMLLANEAVAEELVAAGGAGIYRVHEKPDPQKVEDFAKFAQALGYRLESRNHEYHPKTFQKFIAQLEGRLEGRFVAYLMLRSFMQARYSEKNLGHFALATSVYTHFTSPIRRYPDLVVHRLLKECLRRESSTAWQAKMSERLPEIARHASLRERIADEAEREIERIKKAQFMADKIGEEFKGIVFSVSRQGFFVELMDHFVEGFVPVSSLVHNHYVYHEKTRSFVGKQLQRFELGTKVQVSLGSVDLETGRLIFSLV